MEPADYLRIIGIAYQFAELAAVAGNEDGACGNTPLDRLSDRASLPGTFAEFRNSKNDIV
jgi:hypothetical protein